MKGRKLTTLSFDKKFPENILANDLETLLASFLTFGFSSLLHLFISVFRNQFSVDSKKKSTFNIHNSQLLCNSKLSTSRSIVNLNFFVCRYNWFSCYLLKSQLWVTEKIFLQLTLKFSFLKKILYQSIL